MDRHCSVRARSTCHGQPMPRELLFPSACESPYAVAIPIRWSDLDGAVEIRDGFIQLSPLLENKPPGEQCLKMSRIERQCAIDIGDGLVVLLLTTVPIAAQHIGARAIRSASIFLRDDRRASSNELVLDPANAIGPMVRAVVRARRLD